MRTLILSLMLVPCVFGQGTYTAASCSRTDVNAVINGPTHTAVDGDVIKIPAGICTWTSGIVVPDGIGITIQGAGNGGDAHNSCGSGNTTIIDSYTSSPSYLFYFKPTFGASTSRVSCMTLSPQSGISANSLRAPLAFQGTCASGGCPSIRVDHLVIPASPDWGGLVLDSATLVLTDNVFGVLDHNSLYHNTATYYELVNFNHSSWQGVGLYGDKSWAVTNSFGTDQSLYVESNYFEETGTAAIFPITEAEAGFGGGAQGGGRIVCRFNTAVGLRSMCVNHGTESNGRPRGGRQMEFYKNSMSCPSATYQSCWNNGMLLGAGPRSGSLYQFANSFTGKGINNFASIAEYRALQSIGAFGACDGSGLWDQNDGTTYYSGTISSVTGSNPYTITVSGTPWTSNQWVSNGSPYSVHDVTINNGSEITANTANTLTVTAWTAVPYAVGDSIQIRRATACIDQTSRGAGDLLSGSTPSPTGWVNQVSEPVYEAADTSDVGAPSFGAVASNTARIIANRDYYAEVSQSAQTSPTSPFNGTVGTGYGTVANRPSTCTTGVGYWATDEGTWNTSGSGGQGRLYKCTSTNTWTLAYTPYTYPHPLVGGGEAPPPPSVKRDPTAVKLLIR